ncbi:unnamed protein product [Ranitomeya imitator]|uniref:Uncharacterized protein n=1 Tax=Ranitomeya imitator TaxID=111125 RepID=A0ABN9LP48_9NEOB|nr:unnamed protein product [Ranitomeya imitator]
MAEDHPEQKQSEEEEVTREPTISEDEDEPPADATEQDPSEVLCPGHIILHCGQSVRHRHDVSAADNNGHVTVLDLGRKALQQVVSESKKSLRRVTDLKKSKCSKPKKTCKKKPSRRPMDAEEPNSLRAENENSVPEAATDPLFSFSNALEYAERTCSTIAAPGSRLQSFVEESLEYEDLYSMEEMDEVEFVAEVRLGDVEAYSGIVRGDRHWRFQKSVCLSTSGLQLTEGQSAIKETLSGPPRTGEILEPLKCPLNLKSCTSRTLHRAGWSANRDVIQYSEHVQRNDLDRTLQQKSPTVPGFLWPDKESRTFRWRQRRHAVQ